jgi:hypothetical protein
MIKDETELRVLLLRIDFINMLGLCPDRLFYDKQLMTIAHKYCVVRLARIFAK